MNALVRKELRLILPAWGVAMAALLVAPMTFGWLHLSASNVVLLFCLGMLVLGISSFGREFASRSFSLLLAQPFPRERLWRAKIRQLAATSLILFWLFAFVWANGTSVNEMPDWDAFWIGTCAGLAVLTGGLWTTLLFRQVTAAFWITLLTLSALGLGTTQLTVWFVSRFSTAAQTAVADSEHSVSVVVGLVFVLYSIAGYWWARRLFLRAQDVGWAPVEVTLPGIARRFKAGTRPVGEPSRRPLRALLLKEFQLHSLSLFFAAGVLVLHVAAIGLRKSGGESNAWRGPATIAFVFWFILPVIAGAEAVASERQLGTIEGQLCLPARRRTQFALKLLYTLVAGVILGGVMPWLLERAARALGIASELETNREALCWFSAFAASVALTSFYASSFTRSTLQALGGAVMGVIGVWILILLGSPAMIYGSYPERSLFHVVGGPTLAVTLVGLSCWNFKRLHQAGQLWSRNLAVLVVWLVFTVVATPLVYNRAWELVIPLELPHGPARITGTGRTEICSVAGRIFILLPDGRLWARTESDYAPQRADSAMRIRLAERFIGGSNWTALAATGLHAAGVKADGSLWEILETPQSWSPGNSMDITPKRIGSDSGWKSVSASGQHFLALKQDGSIWGWGDNSFLQLGEGPKQFTNGPARIGQESDWTAVFASGARSAAVKRDGSLWMWGGLYHLPDGTLLKQTLRQPNPVRWNLPGTNLVSIRVAGVFDLALYSDGSVQAVGRIPPPVLLPDASLLSDEAKNRRDGLILTPIRFNPRQKWHGLVLGDALLALQAEGSIWKQSDWWSPEVRAPFKKLSEHSDWVAVTEIPSEYGGAPLALAADGTLCCWPAARAADDPQALLRPTRGPLWSLNILDAVK